MGQKSVAYRVFLGKPAGKAPLGRHSRVWEEGCFFDPKHIVWEVIDWIELAQDKCNWRALVNTAKNLWVS